MPKVEEHSMEVKKIVFAMQNDGKKNNKISKELRLPKSSVQSIIRKVKDVGYLENLSRSGKDLPHRYPTSCQRGKKELPCEEGWI